MTWEFTRLMVLNHDHVGFCVLWKHNGNESPSTESSYVGQITSANLSEYR